MLTIGCHLSKRRGYLEMAKEAASINANTFQYFTRSPRGSEQAALDAVSYTHLDVDKRQLLGGVGLVGLALAHERADLLRKLVALGLQEMCIRDRPIIGGEPRAGALAAHCSPYGKQVVIRHR